jgi:uncharacterized membrane protein YedE/YeeE
MEIIYEPWPWYVAGPLIALVMFLLLYFGKSFGISDNLRTLCTIAGGKKFSDYFNLDWKTKRWNLIFSVGAIIGGFIASRYLTKEKSIDLNPRTVEDLAALGFNNAGLEYLPPEIYSPENFMSVKGLLVLIIGGFLVGFGTRYAGGCTSGHAISGLSNLQLPSLIAVIGFFAGGLAMVHLIFPFIFS